jgi:glycosyltransferase involved in cell wall biosynthesis
VRVVRVPVAFRVSKGVIMPTIGFVAWKQVIENDIVCLHLPQFDAAGIAGRGRLLGKPTTLTYHCDLKLPFGPFSGLVNRVVDLANHLAGLSAHRVVAYTRDFASNSPYLIRFADKVEVIPPPVEMEKAPEDQIREFAQRHRLEGNEPVIGMAARLAAEKGVEVLLDALPRVVEQYPGARILFAGQHEDVMGEEAYAHRLAPLFERYRDRWTFLGVLTPQEMGAFYPNLDMVLVPSLNSTESFGLVQVEAMLCGIPSIASNLPGVRQPVLQSGMGEVVPIGDGAALADAVIKIAADKTKYVRPRTEIAARWSIESTAAHYEDLFLRLLWEKGERI